MNLTQYKKLGKPLSIEKVDISVLNNNADIVDSALHELEIKYDEYSEIFATKKELNNHINNKENPHEVTKSQVGLSNVENKSSATIRSEITKQNVSDALGYTPYTPNEVDSKLSEQNVLIQGLQQEDTKLEERIDVLEDERLDVSSFEQRVSTIENNQTQQNNRILQLEKVDNTRFVKVNELNFGDKGQRANLLQLYTESPITQNIREIFFSSGPDDTHNWADEQPFGQTVYTKEAVDALIASSVGSSNYKTIEKSVKGTWANTSLGGITAFEVADILSKSQLDKIVKLDLTMLPESNVNPGKADYRHGFISAPITVYLDMLFKTNDGWYQFGVPARYNSNVYLGIANFNGEDLQIVFYGLSDVDTNTVVKVKLYYTE